MSILLFFEILLTVVFTSENFDTSTILKDKFLLFISLEHLINCFLSISHIITYAPEAKNLLAMSKPNPCAPPVIIAVLFLRLNLFIKFYLLANKRYVIKDTVKPINQENDCKNLNSGFHIVAAENINPIVNEYKPLICHPPE